MSRYQVIVQVKYEDNITPKFAGKREDIYKEGASNLGFIRGRNPAIFVYKKLVDAKTMNVRFTVDGTSKEDASNVSTKMLRSIEKKIENFSKTSVRWYKVLEVKRT